MLYSPRFSVVLCAVHKAMFRRILVIVSLSLSVVAEEKAAEKKGIELGADFLNDIENKLSKDCGLKDYNELVYFYIDSARSLLAMISEEEGKGDKKNKNTLDDLVKKFNERKKEIQKTVEEIKSRKAKKPDAHLYMPLNEKNSFDTFISLNCPSITKKRCGEGRRTALDFENDDDAH